MQDQMVKKQGVSFSGMPEVVKYTGTAVALAKGKIVSVSFANLDVTDGSEDIRLDEVKVLTANTPFGGVVAQAYTAAEVTANAEILVYRNKGDVCDALVDGTQDVVVGDEMIADVSLGGLKGVNFAGAATGIAAIALEAYTTDATAAAKRVVLTGEYSQVVA